MYPKPRGSLAAVCSPGGPQSEKNFFLSVNYLTRLDRFLNDAAENRLAVETGDDANSPDL
jgi:hypothetical protein